MSRRITRPLLFFTLALAACGRTEEGRGGLSAEEERRLANVAKMLDDNMVFEAAPEAPGNATAAPAPPVANGQQ
jgi:hypothetical protein